MEESIQKEYLRWIENTEDNEEINNELRNMKGNEDAIFAAFSDELRFGTSGIRGVLGAGTNRINEYVVRRATVGLSNYMLKNHLNNSGGVVIAYDSRHNSAKFAEITARVLSGNGIKTYLFKELTPVSILSYAIEKLGCDFGIMITASHNPRIFNGYKVYNSMGYQVVGTVADRILAEILQLDYFDEVKENEENIEYLDDKIGSCFCGEVLQILDPCIELTKKFDCNETMVIYTPLNGTGSKYVEKCLSRLPFIDMKWVDVQKTPDENFTTCPTPNPEKMSTYNEAFKLMDVEDADIIICTDPDADRAGCAIKHKGTKKRITGNQIAILLLDFLCRAKPPKAGQILMKSIVSSPLAERIAEKNGIRTVNVMTGFKYIGEYVANLIIDGRRDDFYFGFEESNGFLLDGFIRDKDGVSTVVAISIMAAYWKSKGKDLIERLSEIEDECGTCFDKIKNYSFEGIRGRQIMDHIMSDLRKKREESFDGIITSEIIDYKSGYRNLPPSDVIEFNFCDEGKVIIRPSGTEPKLKVYLFLKKPISKIESILDRKIKEYQASNN